jgi:hypothetical protein
VLADLNPFNAEITKTVVSLSLVLVHYILFRLAAMYVCFVIEHFIFEPILVVLAGNSESVKRRGGFYYNFRIGELYRQINN